MNDKVIVKREFVWLKRFWTENGTRLSYAAMFFAITIPMYVFIPALQEKLQGLWLAVAGIFMGKIRMSFGEKADVAKDVKKL